MKKILIILSFSLFASSNLFAESFKLNQFNKWLSENGYHQYLTEKENPVCKAEKKYSNLWYYNCLLYTSPSPRDVEESRMPSSA